MKREFLEGLEVNGGKRSKDLQMFHVKQFR